MCETIILSFVLYDVIAYFKKERIWQQNPKTNILVQKGQEWEFRKLQEKKLRDFYRSANIVTVIKFLRVIWASHAARAKTVEVLSKCLLEISCGKSRKKA